jgi:hypothetical protein
MSITWPAVPALSRAMPSDNTKGAAPVTAVARATQPMLWECYQRMHEIKPGHHEGDAMGVNPYLDSGWAGHYSGRSAL